MNIFAVFKFSGAKSGSLLILKIHKFVFKKINTIKFQYQNKTR